MDIQFDRNTIAGIDFLAIGLVVSALGYIGEQSIPIAALGFAIAIVGALILLIEPESIPRDAYSALLKDSITNVEIILEETQLRERAYFIPLNSKEDSRIEIRAFVPVDSSTISLIEERGPSGAGGNRSSSKENSSVSMLLEYIRKTPRRFITSYGGLQGLLLVPPGNDIVRLAKVEQGTDVEEALRSVLVEFGELAGSVLVAEEGESGGDYNAASEEITKSAPNLLKIRIMNPKLSSDSPYFNQCLGTPVSCVAACVVAATMGAPVRIASERYDPSAIRLAIKVIK